MAVRKIEPQRGPQRKFLRSTADIAFYGGAAGGGKSFALLLAPLYHTHNPQFGAVIFRKNMVQVRNEGGLWDESMSLYSSLRGTHAREHNLEHVFLEGSRVKFSHLEHDKTVYDWQGAQIPFIGFDEVTHFSEKQFWYMLSRNRSISGEPARIRATCNPDADSWVRKLVDWYIGEDGLPIKERSGILRYFIRTNDETIWGSSREELITKYGEDTAPKSFTFVAASVYDNKILMEKDPNYISNLKALSRIDRERLLGGNWNVRPSAGMFFTRDMFEIIDTVPAGWSAACRYWDKGATKPNPQNPDPDWTRGLKIYKYRNGMWVVVDLRSTRDTPLKVEELIKTTASHDSHGVTIFIEQEPGSSGVADRDNYIRLLSGFDVRVTKPSVDKITRAKPASAQAEARNIKLLRGPWNEEFLRETENFPPEKDRGHDDIVDTLSGAINELSTNPSILDVL